ncbi:phage tail protein [Caballeronia sp. AZ7_KS35]|uniref:phage tail protein n=1 Tax=Caballeronia sp. AZ7_KS35 TaxID=2921762 RepID=UPI00202772D1|nr:phage tail protein [Caballeronia sp. AZ7_KS35]
MGYSFPEGSKFFFSETFASAKAITALSNANPAVATSAAHGFVDGNEILLSSGWEDAGDSVFVVDQLTTDSFAIKSLNTSDTKWYSPGGGVGSAQLISNWIEIPQILTISTSGGDPKFTTVAPLGRRNAVNIPTGFNASGITLSLAHDESNANFQEMKDISRSLRPVAFKMTLSGGVASYGYGYLAVSEIPQLNANQVNTVTASFSLLGKAMSYAS